MNGFLNILKPPGMTSAAVVGKVKRLTGEKHVGHAGTLDPEAAGVLPIMVGKATRLFDYLVDKEKEYVAEIAFGARTDTQDATGHVLERSDRYPTFDAVKETAPRLVGDILQKPGIYSAIKMDGRPLYERARKGETVEIAARPVHVESIRLISEMPRHGMLMVVRCGRGTYIRSLCEDLGDLCGCPAYMRFLLRSQSGVFGLDTAMTLEEAAALAAEGTLKDHLLGLDLPLGHMARVDVYDWAEKMVRAGAKLPGRAVMTDLEEGTVTRVYLRETFWGIAERQADGFAWRAQIAPEEESL